MSLHWPTLLFQAVNFLVLVFVLYRLLFSPLRRHMQARRARIEADLEAARAGRAELEAAQARMQEGEARAAAEEAAALAKAALAADRAKTALLDAARQEAGEERGRLLALVDAERRRAEDDVRAMVAPLVARVAERLLAEIAPQVGLHEAACARLAERLAELEPSAAPVRVDSATGALPAALERALARVATGGATREVRRAPELIAGARVRIGDTVYDGSVQTQIQRALEGAP